MRNNKGFALLELCISIVVLAVLTTITLQWHQLSDLSLYRFPSQYIRLQSEAMLTTKGVEYEDESDTEYPYIRFNEKGNINQARTLSFRARQIIIELGTGRLVYR